MGHDRRAEAYARQHASVFVSRYIGAVKDGQAELVPAAIRPAVEAFVHGHQATSGVDVNAWIYQMLYDHRVRTGRDAELPPEIESTGMKVAKVAGVAALGFGGAMLKAGLGLSRRGLFR